MAKFRYVGLTPGVLADGRPLAPGQDLKSSDFRHLPGNEDDKSNPIELPDNQALFESGQLLEIPDAKPAAKPTTTEEASK